MAVYSFSDVTVTITHPGVGTFSANGTGIGSLNVQMSNDVSAHDVASDGTVMISKIKAENGTIAVSVQQTSGLNTWLMKWYNFVKTSSTAYDSGTITIQSNVTGDKITATKVTPQKLPDRPFQAQGQQVLWNLMAGSIVQE